MRCQVTFTNIYQTEIEVKGLEQAIKVGKQMAEDTHMPGGCGAMVKLKNTDVHTVKEVLWSENLLGE